MTPQTGCVYSPEDMRARRILFTLPTSDLYGCSRVVLGWVEPLRAAGYEPLVAVPYAGTGSEAFARLGVECHVLPMTVLRRTTIKGWALLRLLATAVPNARRLARFIRERQIDLVHTNTVVLPTGGLAARWTRTPHIWHLHEVASEEFKRLWPAYRQIVLRLSHRVVCTSKTVADQFPPSDLVRVIHNGLNLRETSAPASGYTLPPPCQPGAVRIGVIGRLSHGKGQQFLLEAFASMRRSHPDLPAHLYLIGDHFVGHESYVNGLRQTVAARGLSGQVSFTGFVPDMAAVYRGLDIVTVPSLRPEGFSMVVLEAIAAGKPVIATALGGPLEILEHNHSGLLVRPDGPEPLAEALARLAGDPVERARLATAAAHVLQSRFTLESTVGKLAVEYEALLAARPGR